MSLGSASGRFGHDRISANYEHIEPEIRNWLVMVCIGRIGSDLRRLMHATEWRCRCCALADANTERRLTTPVAVADHPIWLVMNFTGEGL